MPTSSPSSPRRTASRAARSSKRADTRRAGSGPLDGTASQLRSRSGRHSSASARRSTPVSRPMGSRMATATRARTGGVDSPRREAPASDVASSAKVAASPVSSDSSTRRPRSRFSSPPGRALAISKNAAAARPGDIQRTSSTRPVRNATRTLSSRRSGGNASSGATRWLDAAMASDANPCRHTRRRSSAPSMPASWASPAR